MVVIHKKYPHPILIVENRNVNEGKEQGQEGTNNRGIQKKRRYVGTILLTPSSHETTNIITNG